MYSPADPTIDELQKHQELLLKFTSPYLGRTNLDIGCGNGLTSLIHQNRLGIAPTLCDVIDIRHSLARSLPFILLQDDKLPFGDGAFQSSYIQYVLHHLPSPSQVFNLLTGALRVSKNVVIVEELKGAKTIPHRAKAFDRIVNDR